MMTMYNPIHNPQQLNLVIWYIHPSFLTLPTNSVYSLVIPHPASPQKKESPQNPSADVPSCAAETRTTLEQPQQGIGGKIEGRRVNKRRNYRNKTKLVQSAKKNCESNIVNHILGFLSKVKQSQHILERAIAKLKKSGEEIGKIKKLFYDCLRVLNLKRERKYINRKTVLCLFKPESLRTELPSLQEWVKQLGVIQFGQLCYLYRVCVYHFMQNQSLPAILTSKRIQTIAKKIHLKRRTLILEDLEE